MRNELIKLKHNYLAISFIFIPPILSLLALDLMAKDKWLVSITSNDRDMLWIISAHAINSFFLPYIITMEYNFNTHKNISVICGSIWKAIISKWALSFLISVVIAIVCGVLYSIELTFTQIMLQILVWWSGCMTMTLLSLLTQNFFIVTVLSVIWIFVGRMIDLILPRSIFDILAAMLPGMKITHFQDVDHMLPRLMSHLAIVAAIVFYINRRSSKW